MNQIPVTFVNVFTRRRLAQAILPALPAAGDDVYLNELGCAVVNGEWRLDDSQVIEVAIVVPPQMDADGERPLSYSEA